MRLIAAGLFAIALSLILVAGSIAWAAQTQRHLCPLPYSGVTTGEPTIVYCDQLQPTAP